ncbi:unnamed protein product [Ceutorhynchus assimilis]|uniref:DUF7869 domain-containing protein n=1 Tax=Ceutorhynchus assimilis TaxID=467358 RepID=A0A9N9N1C5_9CUCU|nr:unnamed protein product [Ceutorhynchus assimilis]
MKSLNDKKDNPDIHITAESCISENELETILQNANTKLNVFDENQLKSANNEKENPYTHISAESSLTENQLEMMQHNRNTKLNASNELTFTLASANNNLESCQENILPCSVTKSATVSKTVEETNSNEFTFTLTSVNDYLEPCEEHILPCSVTKSAEETNSTDSDFPQQEEFPDDFQRLELHEDTSVQFQEPCQANLPNETLSDDVSSEEAYNPDDESSSSSEDSSSTDGPTTSSRKRKSLSGNDYISNVKRPKNITTASKEHLKNNKKQRKAKKTLKNETRTVREERKRNRNLGLEYTTKKGKLIRARVCRPLSKCKLNCQDKIDHEKRQTIFSEYWQMKSFNKRVAFIASLIRTEPKKCAKRKTEHISKQKNRLVTHIFHLPYNGEQLRVCKQCFLKTFDESNRFVTNVLKNKAESSSGVCRDDKRGMSSSANKIPDADLQLVKEHINSIPSYESHYSRKKTGDKRYLPHFYTLASLYREYVNWLPEGRRIVSRFVYERVFYSMGLKIKLLKKDTCAKCDKFNMLIKANSDEAKTNLESELSKHQKEAEAGFEAKRIDKEYALNDKTKEVFSFDLQQCLPTPDIKTSVAFYKRQLWTFNLTVHRCRDQQAFCYMWHEAVAARGANQIASCLFKHLRLIPASIKEITFYSDTCAGQNKNCFVSIMFMLALQEFPNIEKINHKFLTPGHTHMECDNDHSIIEKKKKKYPCPIEHPRDWVNLVRVCGVKKPFEVIEMSRNHFFEYSALLKTFLQQRKVNEDGQKVVWKDIKWLCYSKEPGIILYKTSLDEEETFRKLSFLRKGKTWPKKFKVPETYKGANPISREKKNK